MMDFNKTILPAALSFTGMDGQIHQMQERLLGWNVPPEHSELLHPHWRGFLAIPKFWHLCLALVYFMLMVLSFVGNGCVVWIFSTSKSLKTPSNVFIINLALFDLLMAMEMPLLIANSFAERMIGWQLGCDIYALLGSVSGIGSAINNAAIAYDRYRTISCPIDGRLNGKQAGVMVAFTWFWALPFSVFPLVNVWGKYVPEGFLTTCSFDFLTDDQDTKVFVAAIFVWSYFLPLIMIVYFYSQLMKSVQKHEKMLRDQQLQLFGIVMIIKFLNYVWAFNAADDRYCDDFHLNYMTQAKKMNVKSLVSNQDKERSIEMKIAKVAFTIFFLFLTSWTPYAVVAMIGAFGNRELLTPLATMLPAVFAKSVSCIDPWVYAINHPRYRVELQKRCTWMGIREPLSNTANDTTSVQTEKVKSEEA